MAIKSKEMTASAMKVVIRKHLVCMSLTVKIGADEGPWCLLWEIQGQGDDSRERSPSRKALKGWHP